MISILVQFTMTIKTYFLPLFCVPGRRHYVIYILVDKFLYFLSFFLSKYTFSCVKVEVT